MSAQLPEYPALSQLTQPELDFVYNTEVLGLPNRKAADLSGLPRSMMFKLHIQQARELVRAEIRGSAKLSKEDVIFGITEAIDRARIIAEPATEIAGWKQISTMLGYDAPTVSTVNVRETITVVQQQVKRLPDSELVKLLGAGNVIDVDFYEAKQLEAKT